MVYIQWTSPKRSYSKLFTCQQRIQKLSHKNSRKCRNFQRMLRRSHLVQLLIINEIIRLNFLQIKQSIPKNFLNTQNLHKKIFFSELTKKKYCEFLRRRIISLLWVLAISPMVQQKRNSPNICSTDNSSEIYETLYRYLSQSSANYIFINQFSNLFQNKYAILSNVLIEKKFFLYWLNSRKKKNWNFSLKPTLLDDYCLKRLEKKNSNSLLRINFIKQLNAIGLKKLIINLINLNFFYFFENEKMQPNYRLKNRKQNSTKPNKQNSNKIRLQCRKNPIFRYKKTKNLLKCDLILRINNFYFFRTIHLLLKKKRYWPIYKLNFIPKIKKIPKVLIKKKSEIFTKKKSEFLKSFAKKIFYLKKKVVLQKNCWLKSKNFTRKFEQKPYYFFQYHNIILIAFEKTKDRKNIQNSIEIYARYYKLQICYQRVFNIKQGLICFGWFFIKKSHQISVYISEANLKNHQSEIKKYLQTTQKQPIDEIIYELNKKILNWQKFYQFQKTRSKTYFQMNTFLFWQIWQWIKKRYKNKSAKWLYKHYWKKSTAKNWIFSTNHETLILYKN